MLPCKTCDVTDIANTYIKANETGPKFLPSNQTKNQATTSKYTSKQKKRAIKNFGEAKEKQTNQTKKNKKTKKQKKAQMKQRT